MRRRGGWQRKRKMEEIKRERRFDEEGERDNRKREGRRGEEE